MLGCVSTSRASDDDGVLVRAALAVLQEAARRDPSVVEVVRDAHAFAVFPQVSEDSADAEDSIGKGALYQRGWLVGLRDLPDGAACAIVAFSGSQAHEFCDPDIHTQIIFFEDSMALKRFQCGDMVIAAQAPEPQAFGRRAAGIASVPYSDGVKVFALDTRRALVGASFSPLQVRRERTEARAYAR